MQDSSRLASLLDTAEEEEAEPGGTDGVGPAPRRGRPEGGEVREMRFPCLQTRANPWVWQERPYQGRCHHLFLGKKSNSRSKEGLDNLVTEELIDSYDSVTSQTASSIQNKVWCSQGTARWHASRGAHPASRSRNRGITMHCAIDQAILDSTGPSIPASQKVAKIKSILVASDTCTPGTNPCSTQKESAFSYAYILDKPTSSDVTALSDSQEGYAPRRAHSHMSALSGTAKEAAFSDFAAFSDVAAFSEAQKRCAPLVQSMDCALARQSGRKASKQKS